MDLKTKIEKMKTEVKVEFLKAGEKTLYLFKVQAKQSIWKRLLNLFFSDVSLSVSVNETAASTISNTIYNQIKKDKKKTEFPKIKNDDTKKEPSLDHKPRRKRNYKKKPKLEGVGSAPTAFPQE